MNLSWADNDYKVQIATDINMSEIHQEIVHEIYEEYRKRPETVAINILGSVARGEEKPDSDVDIQVISNKAGKWFMENKEKYGIEIDIEICPEDKLLEWIEKYPFLGNIYLDMKCVYDSKGIMKKAIGRIKKYFKDNPEVAEFWKNKRILKKELKKTGQAEGFSVKCYDEAEILFSKEHKVTRDFFLGEA